MDTVELQVSGMDCAACEQRISNALRRLDGVREVDADHRTGTVRLTVTQQAASRAAVIDRVEAAGFTIAAGARDTES